MAPKKIASASRSMKSQERRWQAESALSTLNRAAEIQRDRRLMSDVQRLAKEQITALSRVAGKAPAKAPAKRK